MELKRPHILITNDDGIFAPGILHLWKSLKDFADLTIIAPALEQSATGLSITVRSPLQIQKHSFFGDSAAYSVNGTPADCVKLAVSVIIKHPIQLVVSGINRGSNAGRNILYSGTVAGAIEAVLQGIPGIAFSNCDYDEPDYERLEPFIEKITRHHISDPMPKGTLLNVNFPLKSQPIKGVKLVRQGLEFWGEDPEARSHPAEGHSYYWLGAQLKKFIEHEDSDITWLSKGYATAVPVHVDDLTHYAHLEKAKEHFEKSINKSEGET